VATSKGSGAGKVGSKERRKDRQEAVEKRRRELLERIRQVDPEALHGLTLRVGDAQQSAADDDSFHKYFFKGPDFIESWRNVAEVPEPVTE
jgi:hypothetical protein